MNSLELGELSSGTSLVLELVKPGKPDIFRIQHLLETGIDWTALHAFAGWHQLNTFLYPRLVGLPLVQSGYCIPGEEFDRLRRAYLLNIRTSIRYAALLLGIQSLLRGNGIELLALRGPALSAQIYHNPGLRVFSDLDILISPKDLSQAFDILSADGWQPALDLSPKERRWIVRGDRDMGFGKDKAVLEVHWEVDERGYSFPLNLTDFLENTMPQQVLDGQVNVPEPSKSFLLLCLHGVRHQWDRLVWAVDLAWFVKAYPDFDWDAYWDWATGLGFRRVTVMGMLAARLIGGAEFPPAIWQACLVDQKAVEQVMVALKWQLVNTGEVPDTGYRRALRELGYDLAARERLGSKLFLLADRLFTPRQSDWRGVSLPAWAYPLYYLLRPLRLIFEVIRMGLNGFLS